MKNDVLCLRCGHRWEPRTKRIPASCPACKSYKWAEAPTSGARKELIYDENTDIDAVGRDRGPAEAAPRTARAEFEELEQCNWRVAFPVNEAGAGALKDAPGIDLDEALGLDGRREGRE